MLTIFGDGHKYCDGVSRRDFLRIGAAGFGGLTLTNLLRAEAALPSGLSSQNKAIINIHLGGGPPQIDMWDMKPEAPREFRGEFKPIPTNVPGLDICELFPLLARMADRFSIVRTVVGTVGLHENYQTSTGWGIKDLQSAGGRPSLGSVASKLIGSLDGKAPPYLDFVPNFESMIGKPGFLGPKYAAYSPDPYGVEQDNLRRRNNLTDVRIDERLGLLQGLDQFKRRSQETAVMGAMDVFRQQAVNVLTSGKIGRALDLTQEDPRTVARYRGERAGDNARAQIMTTHNDRLLMARRLIEAGVRCVTTHWGGWDTHTNNFVDLKPQLPKMDIGLSALIEDLTARGMFDDVIVVVWGEFGRTPRINNNNAGRDHWVDTSHALVFGGGIQGGQVVGATNPRAEYPVARPVHFQEMFATFYHLLGIDLDTQFMDLNGRPQYLLDHRQPVTELL